MKFLTNTILILALPFITLSQQGLDSSNYSLLNQSKSVFVCETNTPSYANTTGMNVTWDYSQAIGTGEVKTLSYLLPDSTSFASEYASYSNYAMEVEGFITTYKIRSSNNMEETGYVLPNTDLGDIKAKFFTNSWNQYNYPFQYNANNVDGYTGNLSFVLNGNAQNPSCYGNGYSYYDGYGRLIQANGDTLNNVSRLRTLDTTYTTIPVFGQVRLIREQFEYFTLDSLGAMPVFIYAHAYVLSSFPNPLIDLYVVLSDVQPESTTGIDEEMANFTQPVVYPNPSHGTIHIKNMSPEHSYSIFTMDGKLMKVGKGTDQTEIHLENGVYLVQIEGNQQRYTEKIIVRK